MARCFICGKYASNRMKCGTYICGYHTNMLGGILNYHNIIRMTPEQVFYILGIDDDDGEQIVYRPSEQDKAMRRGIIGKYPNGRQTVIINQNNGCMAAIGWFFVIVFIILPLYELLAYLLKYL